MNQPKPRVCIHVVRVRDNMRACGNRIYKDGRCRKHWEAVTGRKAKRKPKTRNPFAAQLKILNERMPVDTPVRYWTGPREGHGRVGHISRPFGVLDGHTIVGWVDNARGCIAASHIEPLEW